MTTDTSPLPHSPEAERAIRLVYFPTPQRQGPQSLPEAKEAQSALTPRLYGRAVLLAQT